MHFYRLARPTISTADGNACISDVAPYISVPGINCWGVAGACGKTRGNALSRIRMTIPPSFFLYDVQRGVKRPDEHQQIMEQIRDELPIYGHIEPGTSLGYVNIRLRNANVHAFELIVGGLIISEATRQILQKNQISGWHTEPVLISGTVPVDTVIIHELVVDGIGQVSPRVQTISECPVCGRKDYASLEGSVIDDAQWDGSDFFRLPQPLHGTIYVSEKVYRIFANMPDSNIDFIRVK